MNEKLRPCPFCGGEAYVLPPDSRKCCRNAVTVSVECAICGAKPFKTVMPATATDEEMYRAAATAWNRRVSND
ncbi:MAG: Lar family restriction alleviation protein [Synergistaceae bacterium]|nr:Lar family restriction alleviation protein [Synergistaceae bacterium]